MTDLVAVGVFLGFVLGFFHGNLIGVSSQRCLICAIFRRKTCEAKAGGQGATEEK